LAVLLLQCLQTHWQRCTIDDPAFTLMSTCAFNTVKVVFFITSGFHALSVVWKYSNWFFHL
jgi:hypothetical protein